MAVEIREELKEGWSQGLGEGGHQRIICITFVPKLSLKDLFEETGNRILLFSLPQCLVFSGCNFICVVSVSGKA